MKPNRRDFVKFSVGSILAANISIAMAAEKPAGKKKSLIHYRRGPQEHYGLL
jgi:hypothetical protein